MKTITTPIMVFANLNVACFDMDGGQIPELQKSLPALLAEHAERCGYDLNGATIETANGKWKMIRMEGGSWVRESV